MFLGTRLGGRHGPGTVSRSMAAYKVSGISGQRACACPDVCPIWSRTKVSYVLYFEIFVQVKLGFLIYLKNLSCFIAYLSWVSKVGLMGLKIYLKFKLDKIDFFKFIL